MLHILLGDSRGDQDLIKKKRVREWKVPKGAKEGDPVVLFFKGENSSFLAEGRIASSPEFRTTGDYRSTIDHIQRYAKPVPLSSVEKAFVKSGWNRGKQLGYTSLTGAEAKTLLDLIEKHSHAGTSNESEPEERTLVPNEPKQYVSYWTPENAEFDTGKNFEYAWSAFFNSLTQDDTLWMVTSKDKKLFLLARGRVKEVLPQNMAKTHPAFRGKKDWPEEGKKQKYWAIIQQPSSQIVWNDITDIKGVLRFVLKNGVVLPLPKDPAQWGNWLRGLHKLSTSSTRLLQTRFGAVASDGALAAPSEDIEAPEETNAQTVTNYTTYWKPQTAKSNEGTLMVSAASARYKRVLKGDVLWILMVKDAHLYLVGMGAIEEVMTDEQAVERFGDDRWEAECHVAFKKPYVPYELRDITDLSKELRFEGSNSSLPDDPGKWANALRALRKPTQHSVKLLANRLQVPVIASDSSPLDELKLGNAPVGAGFGDSISNRKVEKAAIKFVTSHFEKQGWKVTSKEQELCGYDLLCEKGKKIQHLEVKGVKGVGESVILTRNEVAYLDQPSSFVCVVTSALSMPKLTRYSGEEFKRQFKLNPYAFMATKV